MIYQFSPSGRVAATTLDLPSGRVSLLPGQHEMDDDLWGEIKSSTEIKSMLGDKVLQVIQQSSAAPKQSTSVSPASETTAKPTATRTKES